MRTILLILLFTALISAQDLQNYVTPYLYSHENYSSDAAVTQIDMPDAHYVLVRISGSDTFLLQRGAENYTFLNDSERIFTILRAFNANATAAPPEDIAAINALVSKFDSSRNPKESDCRHSTGEASGRPCTAQQCEACMTVPICFYSIPYFGVDFTSSIGNFVTDVRTIDAQLAFARRNLTDATNDSLDAHASLENASASLNSIQGKVTSIGNNHLFGCDIAETWCYSPARIPEQLYCFPIPYNTTALAQAYANTTQLKNRVITNSTLRTQASTILSNTQIRFNNYQLHLENETFAAFVSQIQARSANITHKANSLLMHLNDTSLSTDLSLLSELELNISQYGLQRNYSAANATARQFYVLAALIQAKTENLSSFYQSLLDQNESAALALFEAELSLEPTDIGLRSELYQYSVQKSAIDSLLLGPIPIKPSDVPSIQSDLEFIESQSKAITEAKRGQRRAQLGVWIITPTRFVSVQLVRLASMVIPLTPDQKETAARSLPSILVVLAGLLTYLGFVALFLLMVVRRRVHLHRVAIILWAIIFVSLFILVGIGVWTGHSVIQNQAERSIFHRFNDAVRESNSTVLLVAIDNETTATGLASLRACRDSLSSSLAGRNKSVLSYEFNGDACTRLTNNSGASLGECTSEFGDYPIFSFHEANTTSTRFYVYYQRRAYLEGSSSFYDPCLIAQLFGRNETG